MAKKTTKKQTTAKTTVKSAPTNNRIMDMLRHVWQVLLTPNRFFKKIIVDGNLKESIIRAAIFGLIGGVSVMVLGMVVGTHITFWDFFTKLVVFPIFAVVVLFVSAGLMMLFSEITDGSRDWELAVKGISSIFFIYPVILIVNSFAFSCWSLWLLSMAIDVYLLFLIYNIALYCMHGNKLKITALLAGTAVLLLFVYFSDYHATWLALKNHTIAASCF